MWGMVLGLLAGIACRLALWLQPTFKEEAQWVAEQVLDPFGQIFLRTLFFIVVPLVFASLTLGVVQLGRLDKLGPLAGKTFFVFGLNMAVGVALGLVIMNTVKPGHRLDEGTRQELVERYSGEAQKAVQAAEERPKLTFRNLVEMFMPRNLLQAVVDFQILPLIVFALLVGAAGTQLDDQRQGVVREGLAIMVDLSTRIVRFAMLLAPFAVAAMMASLVVKMGLDILGALGLFVLCVLGGIAIHLFGTMTLWIKFIGRRPPAAFFKAIRTVLVTAFSTSSSSATLPTTIAVARQNLGVSASTAGFVLPLGATMNMSGTALYEGCVILFIAQAFGADLSLMSQVTLLVLTVLSAVAVAGIPGASIPVMVGLLASFQVPPDGILLILGVDRILDMARTVLNVGADLVAACLVDRWTTSDDNELVAGATTS
ncbi:MAG: dicarboxylate/amino acid:cation symporter [Verrucomicrobiales bacterium]|nr:dicarboxylate/amino acid:cation symporter [Verrucomicrobiales bacterium]